MSDWSKLEKICPDPDKWLKVYKHYQELLTNEDVSEFWHEQFIIANEERNQLKFEEGEKNKFSFD